LFCQDKFYHKDNALQATYLIFISFEIWQAIGKRCFISDSSRFRPPCHIRHLATRRFVISFLLSLTLSSLPPYCNTATDISLVGGGSVPRPGEVSLAHNGILFLDELPEFNRNVLEALRQPLEDNYVTVARAIKSSRFPAKFMLVGSMNPCPCGWYTDPKKACHCTPQKIAKYLSKISGPLLDRIDIHLEVPSLHYKELLSDSVNEKSSDIKMRTSKARKSQQKRFSDKKIFCNAQMDHKHIKNYCSICNESRSLLKIAVEELGLSARAHDKILKVARTIADLAEENNILPEHISEAIQYRSLDRNVWG